MTWKCKLVTKWETKELCKTIFHQPVSSHPKGCSGIHIFMLSFSFKPDFLTWKICSQCDFVIREPKGWWSLHLCPTVSVTSNTLRDAWVVIVMTTDKWHTYSTVYMILLVILQSKTYRELDLTVIEIRSYMI